MAVNPLQQIELDEIEEMTEEKKEQFKIETLEQANWAFRKLAALQAAENQTKELAKLERERINQFEKKELESIGNNRSFFESLLTIYAMEQRKVDPKFKAKTPYGAINFRKQQPEWKYEDDKLVESLEKNGLDELVRIKKEPNKEELKKKVEVVNGQAVAPDTGLIIDGVTVTDRPDKISISVEV